MEIIRILFALQLLMLSIQVSKYNQVEGMAVLGVDLGSEWMRIGLVKPGVPMEIVLNKETRRKSPMAVYTSQKERLIGTILLNLVALLLNLFQIFLCF